MTSTPATDIVPDTFRTAVDTTVTVALKVPTLGAVKISTYWLQGRLIQTKRQLAEILVREEWVGARAPSGRYSLSHCERAWSKATLASVVAYLDTTKVPDEDADLNELSNEREGWALFETSGRSSGDGIELESLDDQDIEGGLKWPTDEAAWRYVHALAVAGSPFHRRTLEWLRLFEPEEYALITGDTVGWFERLGQERLGI